MKTLYSLLFTLIFSFAIINAFHAQNESIHNLKSNLIKIEADYLDVKIESWNENYINIESEITINLNNGEDKHKLEIQNGIDGIVINSSVDVEDIEQMVITTDKDGNKKYIPKSQWDETKNELRFKSLNMGIEVDGSITIYVPEKMSMEISTLYGNVKLEGRFELIETTSTYGLIEAKLTEVSDMSKVSLHSTYDIVDLTLDNKSDATLKLNTTYGSIFSDLPLESKSTNARSNGSCSNFSEKYVLNEGFVTIDIIATYDNIYVRSN